jgi:hypothetical protein
MTEYGTIRIPKPTYDRANAERKENDETWEELVERAIRSEPTAELSKGEIQDLMREEIEQRVVEQALR